jgi:hypothetical protein
MAVDARRHLGIIRLSKKLAVAACPVLRDLIDPEPWVELPHVRRVRVTAAAKLRNVATDRRAEKAGRRVERVASSAAVAGETPEAGLRMDVRLVELGGRREAFVLEGRVAVLALLRRGKGLSLRWRVVPSKKEEQEAEAPGPEKRAHTTT